MEVLFFIIKNLFDIKLQCNYNVIMRFKWDESKAQSNNES